MQKQKKPTFFIQYNLLFCVILTSTIVYKVFGFYITIIFSTYCIGVIFANLNFTFFFNPKIAHLVKAKQPNFKYKYFIFFYTIFSYTLFSMNIVFSKMPLWLLSILFPICFCLICFKAFRVGKSSKLAVVKKTIFGLLIISTVTLLLRLAYVFSVFYFGIPNTLLLVGLLFSTITYLFPEKVTRTILGLNFLLIEKSENKRQYWEFFTLFFICLLCIRAVLFPMFFK